MKAIVITRPGEAGVLQIQERAKPRPFGQEVLIKVKTAGVNRPDVFQRKGNYPPPPGAPADIPGLEVAGFIEECGPEVRRWKPGDQVCALLGGGGYAEFVIADGRHCLPLPAGLDFRQAASLPETVFTVWHNVFQRGRLTEGEHLLVHGGSSGIGVTAIQLAKAFAARVSVTAGSDEKCQACRDLGADKCINYKTSDFEIVLKDDPADVILDMIGGDYTPKNLRLLNLDGRLVIINTMKGNKCEMDMMDIMRRRLTITGSTLRNRHAGFKAFLAAEIEATVWPLINKDKFRPVIYRTFSFEEAAEAHLLMESNAHIGKIILVNDFSE